jgi:ABC-type branched-subunit amino acid transport system ATPase component
MPISHDGERQATHLEVEKIAAGYDGNLVIREVSLSVGRGEVVAVLGPNGSGKSTILKSVTGQIRVQSGSVLLDGANITNMRCEELARLGIGYVPQENDVFAALTVHENLVMGGMLLNKRDVRPRIDETYDRFPVLAGLRHGAAGRLSGGERKILAMARVLMTQPSVLVLDEPTANLSPIATKDILVNEVRRAANEGTAVLIVEQKAIQVLEVADWAYLLVAGSVEISMRAAELAGRGDIGELFLGKSPTGTR